MFDGRMRARLPTACWRGAAVDRCVLLPCLLPVIIVANDDEVDGFSSKRSRPATARGLGESSGGRGLGLDR